MADRLAQSTRDRGFAAVVGGFFANVWFGWGQADASSALSLWLGVGSGLGLLVAVIGLVIGLRSPKSTGAINDAATGRRFGIIVGVEFTIAGIGAGILGGLGQPDYIPAFICAVVGIHFFSLVTLLRDRLLIPLGVLMCVVAIAATASGLASDVAPSTVTGIGAGALLLIYGVVALVTIASRRVPPPPR